MPYFIVLRTRLRFDRFYYRECWSLGRCLRNKGDGSPYYIGGLGKTLVLYDLRLRNLYTLELPCVARGSIFVWVVSLMTAA